MTYTVAVESWWLLFAWGGLGWIGAGLVSWLSKRDGERLEQAVSYWRRRAFAATVLPACERPEPERRERDWRDSHLHTQVHHGAATRSYTPAEMRAAYTDPRKWPDHPQKG